VSTNHKVLAITASIFKPFGLLSPAVIDYKTFLQKLWQDTTMGQTTTYQFTTRMESAATDYSKIITTQDQQEG
jgi:hypothetical protein